MKIKHILLLILLSAIWGGSFIFMRDLAPIFGAFGTAGLRLFIAGSVLLIVFKCTRYKVNWKRDWQFLVVIGLLNSAIPFSLFSYAALHLPASISVVINTMTPMFGALFAALILNEMLTVHKSVGLLIGALGVFIVSGSKSIPDSPYAVVAILGCILATACYGFSGALIKKHAKAIEAKALAGGSQFFAGLMLLPLVFYQGTGVILTANIVLLMLVFAVVCSAIAYLIYFYLIKELGPTSALSVTFLMPVFGMVWGYIILGEQIHREMLIGAVIIILGTFLVVKPRKVLIKEGTF